MYAVKIPLHDTKNTMGQRAVIGEVHGLRHLQECYNCFQKSAVTSGVL